MQFTKALVTGASSGIGAALAWLLAQQRIPLILVGRDMQRLQQLADELNSQVPTTIQACDLSTPEGRNSLVQVLEREVPDLVVNNAGAGIYGEVFTHTTERELELFHLNATAVLQLTIEAVRVLMTAGRPGVILNVASVAALQVFPCFATYAAAKAFVASFSESVDVEARPHGIRVLASLPGVVDTRFQERAAGPEEASRKRYAPMTADFAAQQIWTQIQKGQAIRIFDWKYRVLGFLTQYVMPKALLVWLLQRYFVSKLPPRELIRSK